MLRKHLKVEPLRWYHHCDRLGMLVWQDVVNGGGRYRTAAVTWPGRYPSGSPTPRHGLIGRADAAGRAVFRAELRATVELLRNVVSLVVWMPFNEGWGQFDARRVAAELAALDPTRRRRPRQRLARPGRRRPAQPALLPRPFRMPRRRDAPAPSCSRSTAATAARRGPRVRRRGRRSATAPSRRPRDLARSFTALHEPLAAPVPDGLSATVYTQLSDVEDEVNGLLT